MRKKRKSVAPKTSRRRSPNYPSVSLDNAVRRVQELYQKDGPAGATRDAALKHIGFSKAHGQALSVLSALKKFGLVSDDGGRIVPTKRAIDIIEFGIEHQRGARALAEAALSPAIYSELVAQFREHGRLPSDESLKPELIADKGFNPKAVGGFLDDFRASLEFAGLLSAGMLDLPQDMDRHNGDEQSVRPGHEVSRRAGNVSLGRSIADNGEDAGESERHGEEPGDVKVPLLMPVKSEANDQATFPLDEGMVILAWPRNIGKDSFDDLNAWIQVALRRIARSAGAEYTPEKPGGE